MFRERIVRHYQSLSPSFKKIADFILTSHQQAAFMSASRMAKHLGVDVATVTRFAQQIGYEGYTQLIREIQDKVLEEMREARATVTDRLEAAENTFVRTLWRDWANLEKSILNLSLDDAQEAIAALQAARRIYIISEGVGAGLAQAVASYLSMIKPEVYVLAQGAFDMAIYLKEMGPEDVAIGIGFTNYAFAATRAMEAAKKVGAKTIGIIVQADCPICAEAEILFACAATEEGYLPSPTCAGAILFALVYGVILDDAEKYNRELSRFQETYADLTKGTSRSEEDVVEDLTGRS
jgi:DNA-binding MurR/RpiR family transcriptional regulator